MENKIKEREEKIKNILENNKVLELEDEKFYIKNILKINDYKAIIEGEIKYNDNSKEYGILKIYFYHKINLEENVIDNINTYDLIAC